MVFGLIKQYIDAIKILDKDVELFLLKKKEKDNIGRILQEIKT